MSITLERLLTRKSNPGETLIDTVPLPPLADGEALLAIDRLALTTNNITYAAAGDAVGYWQCFPTGREGWGQIPAWGFAEVAESRAAGIGAGQRLYGYFPIASHLRVQVDRVTRHGFFDAAAHRQALPAVYHQYALCAADPAYAKGLEPCQAVFRPLFVTAFAATAYLREHGFFGARRAIVSSASSKTAYGVAHCLRGDGIELIGLTSARNRTFVEGLGCYHNVVDYGAIESIADDPAALYIDLAADPGLRAGIHRHLGGHLVYDCLIGFTQSAQFEPAPDLSGRKPKMFFAPSQLEKRRQDGTLRGFLESYNAEQRAFFQRVTDPRAPWIEFVESTGFEAAAQVIAELAAGRSDPRKGHLIRLPH